jgi:hypothetical protein
MATYDFHMAKQSYANCLALRLDEELPESHGRALVHADMLGERPWPAETVAGPMGKLPHGDSLTVWLSPGVPCDFGLVVCLFSVRPGWMPTATRRFS